MKSKALYISGWLLLVAAGFGSGCIPAAGGAGAVVPVMESGRVVRVVDGDTYDVLAAGVVRRVRLLGVDAPEHDQPFGRQATDSVAGVLWAGRPVVLTRRGTDLYGRTLATVRLPVAAAPALALDSLLVVLPRRGPLGVGLGP